MTGTEGTVASAHPTAGPRTGALLERVDRLEAALARGGDRIPRSTADLVAGVLAGVRDRLALGVDHTVVALVGGTGSGKSSVFNALSGLEFADVGVRRPTTSQVTACVWAHDATALLDWLGVARDRRIERESALDGESQADLRGLVLLDLPDHDSVEPEHRAVVDRLLPLVDLLVWVVDPQKYADDALHSGYLQHLVGHEGAMLVVLNQIDTVPVAAQAGLLRDVSRLLEEDGLADVGVHSLSARTGDGIPVLRGVLARAVAGHGVAEVRAQAEIEDAARALAAVVGDVEVSEADLPRTRAVQGLAEAAGLPAMVAAVEHSVRRGRALRTVLGPVQADRVDAVRTAWLETVATGLPARWREALAGAVVGPEQLVRVADERLGAVTVTARPPRGAVLARVLGAFAALVALAALGIATGEAVSGRALSVDDPAVLVAAGAAAVAVTLLGAAVGVRRSVARRRSQELATLGTSALQLVVQDLLADPTAAVLADHRAVRTASAPAAGSPPATSAGAPSGPTAP